MHVFAKRFWLALLATSFCFAAQADVWVTGYYPGYSQTTLPASSLDYSALTHLIHFSLMAGNDGSIDTSPNNLTASRISDTVTRTHAAGKKILISVTGVNGGEGFYGATTNANLGKFVTNLVSFMSTNHYDGIDIDWEPLTSRTDKPYTNFIITLRTALNAITPRPLLCAAVAGEEKMIASIQNQFDQINVMTYDIAGPWSGWETWFNSPLLNGGYKFHSTSGAIPCGATLINKYITNGVAPGKLGVGIAFYGEIWQGGSGGTSGGGVSAPRQTWTNAPDVSSVTYRTVMSTYYQTNRFFWESNAHSPYLSITNANPTNNMFISYEDERGCQEKVSYARNLGLGGVMIWELSQAYISSKPVGQRHPLLNAIRDSLASPQITGTKIVSNKMQVSFMSSPLANYHVQWTTNLTSGVWNTLVTNWSSNGGVMQVTDPTNVTAAKFYRVRTP